MAVSLNSYCSGTVELDASEGVQAYTCTFKATKNENVVLTLTMPGSRWESVTISNLSLKLADGHEVLSSSSVAPSSSSAAVVKYDIKFVVNGKVIQTIKVAEGEIPEAPASVELPKNDVQYSYSFGGWTPEIVAVTGPATDMAVSLNSYCSGTVELDASEGVQAYTCTFKA
ncbi:MAG: hypothetical protein IJ977_07550, partial [Fibrobacter sp.]|nr:hypothetical protein [Fibrobacter sp.]